MAAISADLAFIMVFGLVLQRITGQEPHESSNLYYFRIAILAPIAAGIPGGILYGLQRRNMANAKPSRMGFWLIFWLLTTLLFIIEISFFIFTDAKNIVAAAASLLVFAGIWTYLMEVIYDNPLSFDHLMPDAPPMSQEATSLRRQSDSCQRSTLIRKRRD